MAHLRYTAEDEVTTSPQYPFFSFALLFGFILAAIIAMILVYPGRSLEKAILSQSDSTDADFRYSLLLLQKTTAFDLSYSQIIENPHQAMQVLKNDLNTNEFQDNNLWLNYIILRGIIFSSSVNLKNKTEAEQTMAAYISNFAKQSLTLSQKMQLAKDALAINQAPIALEFYEKIIAEKPDQTIYFYTQVAKTALWAKQCEKAANYFFQQQDRVQSLKDKRYFYFSALDSLTQCDKPLLAIELAKKNIDGLSEDMETYQKLIDVALAGNQPKMAQEFVYKLMQLKAANK